MNKQVESKDVEVLREVCQDVVEDPHRSNHVTLNELAKNERILEHFENLDTERPRSLGYILTNVDWAERWSRGTYTVSADIVR